MMVDTISDKLFTPSSDAVDNLIKENISIEKIKNVGNIMIDTLIRNYDEIVSEDNFEPSEFSIDRDYFVLTLHRPTNLSDRNLEIIFSGISEFTNKHDVLIPAHPRLKDFVDKSSSAEAVLISLRQKQSKFNEELREFENKKSIIRRFIWPSKR